MKFCGKFGTPEEIRISSENLVDKMSGDKWERYRGNDVLVPKEQFVIAKSMPKIKPAAYLNKPRNLEARVNSIKLSY